MILQIRDREWKVDDRLAFLWMSSVAVKHHTGPVSYDFSTTHRDFDVALTESNPACAQFEDEAREIGDKLASQGLPAMVKVIDDIESIFGLNAGEWVSRRWDGIDVNGTVWVS